MQRVCVYCGSSPGFDPSYLEMARRLGEVLASRGLGLVCGGAKVGLLGELADTVLKAGGSVVGIIPKLLAQKVAHQGLTELHVVGSMHERKEMMFELSDAFITLPGGLGTLEETLEVLTWAQLGLHEKPCGLLNVNGYFDGMLSFLEHSVAEGFIRQEHRDMILVESTPEALLGRFGSYKVPHVEKWLGSGWTHP